MYVDPVNPIIKKTLGEFLQKELNYGERAHDFDDVNYLVVGNPDSEQVLYSFKCNNAAIIFQNGGNQMLEEEYAAFACPRDQWDPDHDVTLCISTADFPKTQKVKKSMTEEQQNAIRVSNDAVRVQRQARVDEVATKIAKFKRDFIGAPIRRALLQIQKGVAVSTCEIPYRKDEKYWITSQAPGEASFYIAFNFETANDIQLARIMLVEFKETTRHVKGSVSITYHDKNAPQELISAFPGTARETYSNGILQIKIEQIHVKAPRTIEQPLTFLAGFRQYVAFHIHSMKQQLHKKMRKRVEAFERVIIQARRDPIGTKNWKDQHVGIGEADRELEEEKKVDTVFIHTK